MTFSGTAPDNMVNLDYWSDLAQQAFVQSFPSQQWAMKIVEPYRGLPFGSYLQAARPRRSRALTAPLDPSKDTLWQRFQVFGEPDQQTSPQPLSPLFARLPLDIRQMIYDLLLADHTFHLSAQNHTSRIRLCICSDPATINLPSHECSPPISTSPSAPSSSLLPLLLTCRRVYSEAIPTLYKRNTFELRQNNTTFRFLKFMIPPQRLAVIRTFRLHMRIPHHPLLNLRSRRDWRDLFAFFRGEMAGLQDFFLRLQLLQPVEAGIRDMGDEEGAGWVGPMLGMVVEEGRERGLRFLLVTGVVQHDFVGVWREMGRDWEGPKDERLMGKVCQEIHRRIRLSLDQGR